MVTSPSVYVCDLSVHICVSQDEGQWYLLDKASLSFRGPWKAQAEGYALIWLRAEGYHQ